jgi:hypothetical protein
VRSDADRMCILHILLYIEYMYAAWMYGLVPINCRKIGLTYDAK